MPSPDIDQTVERARSALTEEQQEALSSALFPDTHTDEVEVDGVIRTLRPLPIKPAKLLQKCCHPVAKKIAKSQGPDAKDIDIDADLCKALEDSSMILARYYKWPELEEKIKNGELLVTDLQALVTCQVELQRANDFLLLPLRSVVTMMRFVEISTMNLQSMFSGPHSSSNIAALLKNSSQPIPSPN